MNSFRQKSTCDQLADHLRQEILNRTLTGAMPGIKQLVQRLGVSSSALTAAMKQLEHEGLIVSQGDRRKRLIVPSKGTTAASLRVGVLLYDASSALRYDTMTLSHELTKAGHTVIFASKSMVELGMDVERIALHVNATDVDAWVILAGSRQVLEWFTEQSKPAFALYGRSVKLSIASMTIGKTSVISTLVKKLSAIGHFRIVLLVREERRKPQLGSLEQFFLNELEANGIQTGPFNIPDWEDSPEGLQQVIDALFKHTPPTAIIIGDASLFHATQMHLARRGILAPDHISLICTDIEHSFIWNRPKIAHIQWNYGPIIRRISQWANNTAKGKEDRKQSYQKASLFEGDTIGPVN